jgi:hypothetical protein
MSTVTACALVKLVGFGVTVTFAVDVAWLTVSEKVAVAVALFASMKVTV